MKESIFISSLRAFFVTLFSIAGVFIGLIIMMMLISGLASTSDGQLETQYDYTAKIAPNAEGIRKSVTSDAPVILKINIDGVIGLESLTEKKFTQLLVESREQSLKGDRVKAILLHINSPGGTVNDADAIYRLLKSYKAKYKTPIYAHVDGMCASGGVYISCAADKIFASDTSLIGSVGVILSTSLNFSEAMDKVGIKSLTLYDGKGKDALNPLRPWVKGEEKNIKDAIDYYYAMFVDIVSSNRPRLSKEDLIHVYGADVYPAPIAQEYGYIDESGYTLNKTLSLLLNDVGIHGDNYQVVELSSSSWFSDLFKSHFGILNGQITHHFDFNSPIDAKLQNKLLYFYPGM